MDLKVDIKEEPVWFEETANPSFDSELNNALDNKHFVKIETEAPSVTPALDSRTEDGTVMNLKEETCDDKDDLGETQLCVVPVAEADEIFLKEEFTDSVDLSDGSRCSPSRLSAPSGGKIFPCSVCTKIYRRKIYLERHELVHCEHSKRREVLSSPYLCVFCNKTYKRRPDYQEHMEMHNGVKKHECKVCNKKFGWRQSLRKHMIIHPVKNPFVCKDCPRSFLRSRDLQKHSLIHLCKDPPIKNVQSRSYMCDICNKTLKGRTHFKDHLEMHRGMMKHECRICHRKFKWRQCLRMHMMIHTESRPYPCKVCSKAFRRPSDLRKHSLTHGLKVLISV
ncbi:gastrula zinc finger protein XlCGF46.1 isoform X2 [Anabrus simplex]|uniref:gastrula zinc finger protein XlCGF46.1 isoform X2 n=1 Tax=Anabrus simplex TaxID=316456 RepID=UPI0035A2D200